MIIMAIVVIARIKIITIKVSIKMIQAAPTILISQSSK